MQDTEVPNYIYKRLKIPSLESVEFKKIKQFHTYKENQQEKDFAPVKVGFDGLKNLKHLQMQVDHLESTKFVQVNVYLWLFLLKLWFKIKLNLRFICLSIQLILIMN